jgi:DNA-binding CsgD family transcriptional regulator/pimeloyl-ACP methyl ester carboxylesterase
MSNDEREMELEIVSNSWLSLTSSSGYDAMIESWARKIGAFEKSGPDQPLVDQVVLRQFEPIKALLNSRTEFSRADPLDREAGLTANPVMILSPDGTVASAANGAEDFFGIALGRLAGRGWLCEESEADFDALRRNLLRRGNAGFAILRVRGRDGRETLAEAYGLRVDTYVGSFTVVRSLALDWRPEVSDRLAQAYGMTRSEVEICRLVFELRELDEVAQVRGVSIDTVRTQIKRIFVKLDIHSKAELVKLLAMICARSMAAAERIDLAWGDPLGRETVLTRPDGRKLAYTWSGASHGRKVLLIHGGLPQFFLEPATERKLETTGVSLLCLSMPGHGSSDPPPKGVSQLDDGLAAIEFLLTSLGLSAMPCVASFGGMAYPISLACRAKPLVSAVLLITLPANLTSEAYRALPPSQRVMTQLARYAPGILDLVCRLGWNIAQREGPDFFLHRAFWGSKVDMETMSRADIQPYLRAGSRHLLAQGYAAFLREVVMDANFYPAKVLPNLKVPLHWLAPRGNPTWSVERVRSAKQMSPLITVESVVDAGDLLPYQRPDVFVRAITDLASDEPATRLAQHDDFAAGA